MNYRLGLLIILAILIIQPHVIDNTQGHKHSPPAVVLSLSVWFVPSVRVHHPLIEGKHSLDVSLADTAAGGDSCLMIIQPT